MIDWHRVVILSGPSGVGKDTILDEWMRRNPKVERVIACTTRKPRPEEEHGNHYYFLTEGEFEETADQGGFLEHKNVHGFWYGTPMSELTRILDAGGIAVLKIDVQGAVEVLNQIPEIESIFILPPTFEELERRLRDRGSESEEVVIKRLENAIAELDASRHYRHRIVNEDVAEAVEAIDSIVRAEI